MADLPQDIQRLAIPRDMDARYSGASARPAFDSADPIRVAEREAVKRVQQQDHDFSISGPDIQSATGRIGVASGASRQQEDNARKDEKERRKRTDTQILMALQRRLDGLHKARDVANEELASIRESKAALEDLQKMHEDGTLDPDNQDHQKIMAKAGITREDLMNDPTGAFARQAEFWDEREQNKIREIEDIDIAIEQTEMIIQANPADQREFLATVDTDIVHQVAASGKIQHQVLENALKDGGYSQEEIELRQAATNDGFLNNGGFGFEGASDNPASTMSFASSLDLGDAPEVLDLSADFKGAANVEAPTESLPVLDLSSQFKM